MGRYHVFLSFRGPETRHNLVQYLSNKLGRLGVEAFLDSKEIEYGESISSTIIKAIERSDICVPIFSQDFASSPACLMEVAKMVELGKEIRPIFFFVEPYIVRCQEGTYKMSFKHHKSKNRYDELTIEKWKKALEKIAGNRGLEFKKADLKAALRADLKAALRAPLQAALGAIGHGMEYKDAVLEAALEAALQAALEAALEAALQTALEAALQVALAETNAIQGQESKKAALEAALGEIGVIKPPEFKKAAPGEMGGTKGGFYNDLFSGFQELEDFISELGNPLNMYKKEVTKNLVGVKRHVPRMLQMLGFDYQDGLVNRKTEMTGWMVFVVWGMAGVGKTTFAREVYNNIRHFFDKSSFLENVGYKTIHKDVESLQNKLIRDLGRGKLQEVKYSDKGTKKIKYPFSGDRVLIVLDDVVNSEQIKPLAEEVTWFAPGSVIILTSTTKDVDKHYTVSENIRREHYQVSCMDEDDALELFDKHAITKPDDLPDNYNDLSRKIISAVGRLPFAIKIVGNYLRGKNNKIWNETPDRLKRELDEQVVPLFKENYESLSYDAQQIFLDIACFFTEVEKSYPYYMWHAQRRDPNTSVDKLQELSFLKIEENEFWMHNQLQIFGRATVKDEGREDPAERSRLWDYEDVRTTLREKQVKTKVNALRVTPNRNRDSKFNCFHWENFFHLQRLRFLDLGRVDVKGNSEDALWNVVWLDWHGCSEKSQLLALDMCKLVILDLSSSQVQLSLEDWRTLMRKAPRLVVLSAKDCHSIKAALEFPDPVPLERLILESCLLVIPTDHFSTSGLVNLVTLNMKGCTQIKSLPQELCSLQKLKELLIDETKIEKLELNEGSLPSLEILSACECKYLVDVDSITFLKNLQKLSLRRCIKLKKLPDAVGELDQLLEMDLSHTLIGELPSSVDKLDNLQVLKMVRTSLIQFPEAIKNLKKLEELDFTHCENMKGECIITGLDSLRILRKAREFSHAQS